MIEADACGKRHHGMLEDAQFDDWQVHQRGCETVFLLVSQMIFDRSRVGRLQIVSDGGGSTGLVDREHMIFIPFRSRRHTCLGNGGAGACAALKHVRF